MRCPDAMLEPPADKRRIAFICEYCGEPIYEGEEYWEIPEVGRCCENCIEAMHHWCAEA